MSLPVLRSWIGYGLPAVQYPFYRLVTEGLAGIVVLLFIVDREDQDTRLIRRQFLCDQAVGGDNMAGPAVLCGRIGQGHKKMVGRSPGLRRDRHYFRMDAGLFLPGVIK